VDIPVFPLTIHRTVEGGPGDKGKVRYDTSYQRLEEKQNELASRTANMCSVKALIAAKAFGIDGLHPGGS